MTKLAPIVYIPDVVAHIMKTLDEMGQVIGVYCTIYKFLVR